MLKIHHKLTRESKLYQKWHSHPYHSHLHWLTFSISFLLALVLIFWQLGISFEPVEFKVGFPQTKAQTTSRTYYASPSGGGNGRSASSPFQIKDFWSVAKPGDSLLLLDGRYTGDNSMITPPEGLSGSPGNPITVKALHDGKVEIDGASVRKPVYLRYNDYFILEGFNAHGGDYCVVEITRSNNNIVRRVCAWDAHPNQNAMVFGSHYGSDNLFEDCAGWGDGRKIFGLFEDTRTTFRRCFFR